VKVKRERSKMKLKIYVIGPITYKNSGKGLLEIVDFLREKGFENVFNPLEKPVDHTIDWRYKKEEAVKLYKLSEKFIKDNVDVIVADLRGPSNGRTIEQIIGMRYKKPVIGYAPEPIRTPWPLVHTTRIVRSLEELAEVLKQYC
jgi:nucleoside 2-deoxyribosyltransferase